MRVIVINPHAHNIYATEAPDPKIEGYTAWLNWCYNIIGCKYIDIAELSGGDSVIVDDEGLLTNKPLFVHIDRLQPLAGTAIVTSTNFEGGTIATKTSVMEVFEKISFITPMGVTQGIPTFVDVIADPRLCCPGHGAKLKMLGN